MALKTKNKVKLISCCKLYLYSLHIKKKKTPALEITLFISRGFLIEGSWVEIRSST